MHGCHGWWPKISKKNMIMTGAAAGLAAAFNTPLGGIVFAVEELTKTHINYFKTALFTAVIIAGLTAQGLLGPYLYLGYPNVLHFSSYIIFAVVLVAIITGLAGSTMAKIILSLLRWKRKFQVLASTCPIYYWLCRYYCFYRLFFGSNNIGFRKDTHDANAVY